MLHKKATSIDFNSDLGSGFGLVKSKDSEIYSFSLFEKREVRTVAFYHGYCI